MKNTNSEDAVRESVGSIYAHLLDKRQAEREAKAEAKAQKAEDVEEKPDEPKLSKKEKRQRDLDAWREVVIGLTGDDLDYSSEEKKTRKKKYRKWIDDDDTGTVVDRKPKKIKKKNYNKEFEPELNMLRNLVAEQNKFTTDLQKRFQNAAGPATKDAQMPNKTLVDLASAVNAGRTNSLGLLREIGGLKKTIAELVMKQKKLDYDMAGATNNDTSDIALMGSNIANALFGSNTSNPQPEQSTMNYQKPYEPYDKPSILSGVPAPEPPTVQAEAFDPDKWEGPIDMKDDYTRFENIPKKVVVERDRTSGEMRFAAINTETGEEIVGYDLPTEDPNKLPINETDKTVKGQFDQVFELVDVG